MLEEYLCPKCQKILSSSITINALSSSKFCDNSDCELNYIFDGDALFGPIEEYMCNYKGHTYLIEVYKNDFNITVDYDHITKAIKDIISIDDLRLINNPPFYCDQVFDRLEKLIKLKAFW